MEWLTDFSLEATRWLQENYPQLEGFFTSLSVVGRFEIYLMLITLIYWCLNKRLGRSLAYLMVLSNTINFMLKHAFRDPRPYWTDSSLGLGTEPSYGMPSWHVQSATVFFIALAAWLRRGWAWLLSVVIILFMLISRVYLGVHDVDDALAGLLVGLLIMLGYFLWQRYAAKRFSKRIMGQRLLIAVAAPFILAIIYVAVLLLIGSPDRQVAWEPLIDAAEYNNLKGTISGLVGMLALGIGFVLESSRVRFLVDGPWWKRALRYVVGLAVTLALWFGTDTLIPEDPIWLSLLLEGLMIFLMTLWIAYYAPMTFVRLRLAEASPEPEVSISL